MKRAYMKIGRFPFAFALRGMLALVALMPLYAGAQKAYDARSVLIYVKPDTPGTPNNKPLGIRAGVSVGTVSSFYAHVFDSLKQWKPALDKFITWPLVDTIGNPSLSAVSGDSTSFAPTRAFAAAMLTATFSDGLSSPPISVVNLLISAGIAHHIVIEDDSACSTTRVDNPAGAILLNDNSPSFTVYAVVRDRYGNFARFSSYASWQVSDPSAASVFPVSGKNQQALIVKASPGQTEVAASEPGLISGTLRVSVEGNVPPVPANAVAATATLLDTNKEGHLDRIDISWPDSIKLAANLPSVDQLVEKMGIVTLGSQFVELHPIVMVKAKGNVLQVVLDENKGAVYETAWDSLKTLQRMTLKNTPLTIDNRALVITRVVDSAAPVVASLCLTPSPRIDSLTVVFSGPIDWVATSFDPSASFGIQRAGQILPISQLSPLKTVESPAGVCTYLLTHGSISPLTDNALVRASQIVPIAYCPGVSLISAVRACANPFKPGASAIPESQLTGGSDPRFGAKIEVQLISLTRLVSGTLIIFDAVGNAVTNKIVMKKDYIGKSLYWIWDGKNRFGTLVGLGTYLARVTLDEGDAASGAVRSESARILIGVKG